ncbi:MAG: UPF0182 family protein [Gemmatimonadaceae bacterium]
MSRGQRLAAAIAVGAFVLLAGRGAALVYSNEEWFSAMGAGSVWRDRLATTALLYGLAFLIGVLFAWANVSAVRRSVVALIVPKRLANVEFGEEVPSSRLRLVTAAVSIGAAVVSLIALPSWTTIALWQSDVVFGEADPYFNLDLSHFVTWLPVESAIYIWCLTLFAIVTALIVTLYALTPSLSWGRRGLRVAGYARRHISALGAILVLFAAWGFRLDAFNTLIDGSGPGGAFTRIDHTWIVPADLGLSLVTVGAAVVLLAAGWMGQVTTAFVTVSLVIASTLATQVAAPLFAMYVAQARETSTGEQPYRETRDAYTARAFPSESAPATRLYAAAPALVANAATLQLRGAMRNLIYPGATGALVVPDPNGKVVSPRLGSGFARLMHAWAEQNPHLLQGEVASSDALVSERDVRSRVRYLAPVFAQSRLLGAVPTAGGILWIVDLYSTSETYPLSVPRTAEAGRITYRHHAATAYVSAGTANTFIIPDQSLDPVARAWFDAHPGSYITDSLPRSMTAPPAVPARPASQPADSTGGFRADVSRIYARMRTALDSSDLRAFGVAFDSLGIIVAGRR